MARSGGDQRAVGRSREGFQTGSHIIVVGAQAQRVVEEPGSNRKMVGLLSSCACGDENGPSGWDVTGRGHSPRAPERQFCVEEAEAPCTGIDLERVRGTGSGIAENPAGHGEQRVGDRL